MNKTYEAVFSPQKTKPAILDTNPEYFEDLWKQNKPWVLSNMSHTSYLSHAEVEECVKKYGANDFYFYDKNGAQAFLAIWTNMAILSFRGSQPFENFGLNKKNIGFYRRLVLKRLLNLDFNTNILRYLYNDVIADLTFKKVPIDEQQKILIHQGFLKEINKLWDTYIKNDLTEKCKDIPVWATGHSLGGAMATIAGMRYPFEEVITFGEPRVGKNIQLAFKAKNHTRYINGDDPVPKLPPELLFNYNHHGTAINICDLDGETNFQYDHSIVYYSENLCSENQRVDNQNTDNQGTENQSRVNQ